MNILLKGVTIIDSGSKLNGTKKDILIKNGIIEKIAVSIPTDKSTKVVSVDGMHVSSGWVDIKANFFNPGLEQHETIETGLEAAKFGGFVAVALSPATSPCVDNKSIVEFLLRSANNSLVDVLPYGTLSEGLKGQNLSEMYDMHLVGAVGFTDDKNSIENSDLMKRALLYSKDFGATIFHYPNDKKLAGSGKVHEGEESTKLGLKGIPSIAEELMLARDLFLLEYYGGKIHFNTLSTEGAVKQLKAAKAKKLNATSDIASHQLYFTDSCLQHFDSHYKVLPPFRTKTDVKALIKGLKEDTIDAICSDHCPQDVEAKQKEFDLASYGIIGLETCFAAANTMLKDQLGLEQIIDKFTKGPRKILNLPDCKIAEGEKACLTLFNPNLKWEFESSDIKSKSKNTPFVREKLIGKALGIVNKGKIELV